MNVPNVAAVVGEVRKGNDMKKSLKIALLAGVSAIAIGLTGCTTTSSMSKCDKARLAVEAAQQAVGYFCPITLR